MSRKAWLALASLVLLIGIGVVWLVRSLDSAVAFVEPVAAHADTPEKGTAKPASTAALETSAADPASREAAPAKVVADDEDSGPSDAQLADAVWVEGRVVVPNETPLDEELWVVAKGRKFGKRALHKVKLGNDGHFRVAFAKETKKGQLDVEAHYLYLNEVSSFDVHAPPPEIVLQPIVGGRLRGTCRVPSGRDDLRKQAAGGGVATFAWDMRGGNSRAMQRSTKLDSELAFDLGGLAPATNYRVDVRPKDMTVASKENMKIEAGKTAKVELELSEGVRVIGRVVDASGAGVAKAQLNVEQTGRVDWMPVQTAEDGTFTLAGLNPGALHVNVHKDGFLDAKHDVEDAKDGEIHKDVVVRLERGMIVRGRVTWPDGSPAAKASVRAESEGEHESGFMFFGNGNTARTDADGRFEIGGLPEGLATITVTAKPESMGGAASKEDDDKVEAKPASAKKRPRGPSWFAKMEHVRGGEVAIVLSSGLSISGRVIDDAGAPLERFTVIASPEEVDGFERTLSQIFTVENGAFELGGFEPGTWSVHAERLGIASQTVKLDVPIGGAVEPLVIPRAGKVTGTVRDPAGRAIAAARVHRVTSENMGWGRGNDGAPTDAQGNFTLSNVPSGTVKVTATAAGFASSVAQETVVRPNDASAVDLVLRVGGTIRGVVHDATGRPEANRPISAWCQNADWQQVESDAEGRFALEHLEPGTWQLQTQPTNAEREKSRDAKGEYDWESMQAVSHSKKVELADGQIVDLVLGGARKDGVVLRGLVTSAGKPLAGARVHANRQSNEDEEGSSNSSARTGDDGRYELSLPGPGHYWVNVRSPSNTTMSNEREVTSAGAELDFAFGGARVRGRTVDREGNPVAGVNVSLEPEVGRARGESHVSASRQTEKDGTFAFEEVAAGKYSITVNGSNGYYPRSNRSKASWAGARLAGVEVPASGEVRDLVIVLDRGGTIRGVVLGVDGSPAEDVGISVLDARGLRIPGGGWASTDEKGRFTVSGVAPGRYFVHAQNDSDVAARVAVVDVTPESTPEASLTLVRGCAVVVEIEDAQGKPVGGFVHFVDEQGFDRQQVVFGRRLGEGDAPGGSRYSPLPPGRYRLSCENKDGQKAEAEVTATTSGDATVKMRYGGG